MSMLSLALNEVSFSIPTEILEAVFMEPYRKNYYVPTNLDSRIVEEVISKRVMPDLNVEYAVKLNIEMAKCQIEMINPQEYIVTVPPSETNGRKIITVLGLNYVNMYASAGSTVAPGNIQGGLLIAAQKMANGTGGVSLDYDVKVDLISGNSFRVRRSGYLSSNMTVEVIIENDPQLNNIPLTAADYVKKLVVLATKAYIYNKMKIRVNQAMLSGGSELGAFGEFIDSYADANELYLEELKSASRIQWQASEEMKYDYMQMLFSNLV